MSYLTRISLRLLLGVILFGAGLRSSFGLPVAESDFSSLNAGKRTNRAALETGSGTVTVQMSNPLNQPVAATQNPSTTVSAVPQTSASTQINLSNATLNLSPQVYDLSTFGLAHATLTLSPAKVLLAGGATETYVLFNYSGIRDVTFSVSGSVLRGILLALNAKVNSTPGLIAGDITSSKNDSTSGMVQRQVLLAVPDSGSSLALFCLAGLALVLFLPGTRRRLVRRDTR
jgi:hypothetical protein